MVTLMYFPIGCLLMHVGEVVLHILRRKHADIGDAKRLEDMFLEVIVETHAGYAFYDRTCPVDAHAILPLRAGLENKRLP